MSEQIHACHLTHPVWSAWLCQLEPNNIPSVAILPTMSGHLLSVPPSLLLPQGTVRLGVVWMSLFSPFKTLPGSCAIEIPRGRNCLTLYVSLRVQGPGPGNENPSQKGR
jgi:hypothetical protein